MSASPHSESFDIKSDVSVVPSSITEPDPCLLRVGEAKRFIQYEEADADAFRTWWKTTEWARNHSKEIRWQLNTKTSTVWQVFKQLAELRNGKPKVLCLQCDKTLEHPGIKHSGTNSLKTHINSAACKRQSSIRGTRQSGMVDYINANVSGQSIFRIAIMIATIC